MTTQRNTAEVAEEERIHKEQVMTTHGDTADYIKHTCQGPPLPTSKSTCQDPWLPVATMHVKIHGCIIETDMSRSTDAIVETHT